MNKLVFDDVVASKKTFHESKIAQKSSEVDVSKIVVSNKIKGNYETSKVFIGYIYDIDVIALCLIMPQKSGLIKYFENGGKNMSFKIKDDSVYLKYNEIWNKITELLGGVKLHSKPIYDGSYIETKVKTFSEMLKTLFDGNKIPEEKVEHGCIACISIDSVLKVDKKNYP